MVICPKCGFRFVHEPHVHGHGSHAGHTAGHMAGLGFFGSMVASLAGHAFESSIKVCPSCGHDFLLSAKPCELASFRVFQPTSARRVDASASVIVRGASGLEFAAIVRFYFADGTPLADHNRTCEREGQVAIVATRSITTHIASFVIEPTLPDRELHLARGQDYPLAADLAAYVVENGKWGEVGRTERVAFRWHVREVA